MSAPDTSLEIERKYAVDAGFVMPDLSVVPGVAGVTGPRTYQLTAVYHDTPGQRLAAARITLRRRTGGTDAGWHLKLPAGAGARREVHAPLGPGTEGVPDELASLVSKQTGGEPLRPIARLQTARTVRHLVDGSGQVLAEVADDEVTGSLPDQKSGKTQRPPDPDAWQTAIAWREVEIELGRGPAGLLDRAGQVLLDAGARPSPAASKLSLLLSAAGPAAQARIPARLRRQGTELLSGRAHRGRLAVSTAKESPPARRAPAIGRWLTGGRSGGSRHRDVQGGTTRAAVLGAGDGLLTNLSLVLGVAGASANASAVRLAGVAGLLAGAFSMAAGELVSVRAQQEMVEREVQVEREELAEDPEGERRELAGMYRAQGLSADDANTVARILSANPDIALDTHARLELGVDPQAPGSAWRAAVTSFLSFSVGAILPLFPWFFTEGTRAVIVSVIIGAIAALALGAAIGVMSGRSVLGTALRQLAVAAVAAAVTYGVGSLLGVSTS